MSLEMQAKWGLETLFLSFLTTWPDKWSSHRNNSKCKYRKSLWEKAEGEKTKSAVFTGYASFFKI